MRADFKHWPNFGQNCNQGKLDIRQRIIEKGRNKN